MKLSRLLSLRFLLMTSWVGAPAVGIVLWVMRGFLAALSWFVASLVLHAIWGRLARIPEETLVERWQARTEVNNPELAEKIGRLFESGRTDVVLPVSLAAAYLLDFSGRLALPYLLGWSCYVLFGSR